MTCGHKKDRSDEYKEIEKDALSHTDPSALALRLWKAGFVEFWR